MALVLRTCAADLTGRGGFRWPKSGPVEAPDWDPEPKCGGGLHGLLWGEGDGSLLSWDDDAKWLVVEVTDDAIVDLAGKVKFPRGTVAFCGDRKAATDYLVDRAPGRSIVGAFVTAGDRGTATAGDGGTATAGDGGTATAGEGGTATAGDRGTATAGDGGTATAGDRGTASAGYRGTASAGYRGVIFLTWHDGRRRRVTTLYVGEDGIEPGVPYRLDDNGKPVRVTAGEEG